MSVVEGYISKRDGEGAPYPKRLSEDQISSIIERSLDVLLREEDDIIVLQQYVELAAVLRRDLRRIAPLSNVNTERYVEYIRRRLLDAAILTHDRTGLKAAAATTADLAQQVISEKRGGSGKESGLSMISLFEELMSVTDNRKVYFAWVYPNQDLTREELDLLKRDMIGVRLGDLIIAARVASYNDDAPAWYRYIDKKPMNGYHYELDLDIVRMNTRGVLMSQIAAVIENSFDQKTRANLSVVTSPYADGRVDIYFTQSLNEIRSVSILGAQNIYAKRDTLYVKGIEGVEWITEKKVSPAACILETTSMVLEDGSSKYVTYYSLVPALRIAMGRRHLLAWLDEAGVEYELDPVDQAFYTTSDPRPLIAAHRYDASGAEIHMESRLEIEYSGKDIDTFYLDKRFDISRTVTNDFYANQKRLGISGARQLHGLELFELIKGTVANLDVRHIDLIGDVMSSTGQLTGISMKGTEQRGSDAISRLTFRRPETVIRSEASFGLATANSTLASSHFIGNPGMITGAALWRSVPNPLAGTLGRSAPPEHIVSLRGARIPQPTSSSEEVIQQAREAKYTAAAPTIPKRPALGTGKSIGRRMPTAVVRKQIATSSNETL